MWKRTVRAFKFSQASSALKSGLFSFVTPLRLAIAEIRRECVFVETRRLFAVGEGETITLEAFLERQRTTQQEVAQVCCRCCPSPLCFLRAVGFCLADLRLFCTTVGLSDCLATLLSVLVPTYTSGLVEVD